ncbi:DEAD/DEAH box helicase [Collinsella sp. UBA1693]|uniref:DEAD/DEAH box helicase n=1 Tax=Collinsella sp. UBA1693 TaxID=1946385 RepID=UPI002579D255|nr:DEAD/DEAH box helicase [Collinsella sp. UBA1693]
MTAQNNDELEMLDTAADASFSSESADAADELARFADLGLSDEVLAAVEDLGYEHATPVQAMAIPQVLAGRDILAAAQTGTGKTAAFLLPTMSKLPRVKRARGRAMSVGCGPRMLIITPTRELAQQIDDVCKKVAARTRHTAVTVVGGVSYNPQKSALKRGCDILVATPGRLVDLIDQGACMLDEVQVLVLDEADRMLDMGFLPAVRKIVSYTPADRQTLLFSATLDEAAVGSITDLVSDPARVEIAPATSTAETVEQYLLPVSLEAKNGVLADLLLAQGTERVIVFTRTKRRADTCCRRLARAGISCAAIHGDRSQAQRERALKAFRAGKCDVLVATDVLARGIDVTDVRYVVNFDVPEEPVDYIHRIGRTGRAGEVGWAVTVVTSQDIDEFFDIEALMGKTADLYDAEGLELGENPPAVDPDRVPADKPAGKKAKKRRRAKAEAGSKPKGEGRAPRRPRKQRDERPAGDTAEAKPRSKRSFDEDAKAERQPAARASKLTREDGPRDEALETAPKPSRRKRAGKTRVRAQEASDSKPRRDRGGRGANSDRADRGSRDERGARGERFDRARSGSSRSDRPRSDRFDRPRGEEVLATSRSARDTWRNYDEPSDRRGRGSRGGRAGGRDNRGNYGSRGGHSAPHANNRGGSRRPGDRGGRSSRA